MLTKTIIENTLRAHWVGSLVPSLSSAGEFDPWGSLGMQIISIEIVDHPCIRLGAAKIVTSASILAHGVATDDIPSEQEHADGVTIIHVGSPNFDSRPIGTDVGVSISRPVTCELVDARLVSADIHW